MHEDKNPNAGCGIICPVHGKQGLTREDYIHQLSKPDSLWLCPICKDNAEWDDSRYESGLAEEDYYDEET